MTKSLKPTNRRTSATQLKGFFGYLENLGEIQDVGGCSRILP